jgi:HK97 family phage major capsid protein
VKVSLRTRGFEVISPPIAVAEPVTTLNTTTGASLPIPTDDDTANVGALVAEEGSHASGTAVTLGQTTLKSYLYSSKIVKVSLQLLRDSEVNWEAYLASKFGVRLGRAKNLSQTTGTGSAQPQGVQYASTTGRTCASGYTTAPHADDLVRLVHAVDRAAGGIDLQNDHFHRVVRLNPARRVDDFIICRTLNSPKAVDDIRAGRR